MNRTSVITTVRGHSFYTDIVNQDSIVVDLGAHKGEFSSEVSSRFGCICYLVEALPALYSRIAAGRLMHKYNFAMAGRDERVTLFVSKNPEGNTITGAPAGECGGTVTVEGITLETLMGRVGIDSIDLLKVDIEGAEIALFDAVSDTTLSNIAQITVEFHDFMPGAVSAQQVKRINQRLQGLGFYAIKFSRSLNTDVLFINRQRCNVSAAKYWHTKYVVKYSRGIARIIRNYFPRIANRRY